MGRGGRRRRSPAPGRRHGREAYGACPAGGALEPRTVIVDRAGKIVWMAEGDEAFKPAAITAAFRNVAR